MISLGEPKSTLPNCVSPSRTTLERHMATRLNRVGPETGRRVARFITRLPVPSTGVSRNDFSSLGISSRREVDDAMEDADSNFEGSSSYIHIQVFLVVCTQLYSSLCRSDCRSVCRSVSNHFVFLYFLMIFKLFLDHLLNFHVFF